MTRCQSTLAAAVAALCACAGRPHLWEARGRSVEAQLALQRSPPAPGKRTGPVPGLDSQEASIIAEGYRRSLAPKGVKLEEEPMLIVAPPQQGQPRQVLPLPSVPKD